MAGDNQHHVWRFIQRGFGEKIGKDHHVWVYDSDGSSSRTSTKKFGAEDFYFSEGGDSTADDILTEFENRAQSRLQDIKKLPNNTPLDSNFIAEVITHFEMRSMYIREEASGLFERLIEGLARLLRDPQFIVSLVQAYLKKHPELLEEQLDKAGVSKELRSTVTEFFDVNSRDLIEKNAAPMMLFASSLIESVLPKLGEFAKGAHIKSIIGGFSETDRTKLHRDRFYRIIHSKVEIILPDTGLAIFSKSGMAPMSSKDDVVEAVVCPLTSTSYILGSKSPTESRPTETIRRALASCSYKNFVARSDTQDFKRLASRIGRNAKLVSDRELNKILHSFRRLENL